MEYLGQTSNKQLCVPVQESLRERLNRRLNDAEEQVKQLKDALRLLDANPTLEDFHNAITKVGY